IEEADTGAQNDIARCVGSRRGLWIGQLIDPDLEDADDNPCRALIAVGTTVGVEADVDGSPIRVERDLPDADEVESNRVSAQRRARAWARLRRNGRGTH